jgi:hypothetical protein
MRLMNAGQRPLTTLTPFAAKSPSEITSGTILERVGNDLEIWFSPDPALYPSNSLNSSTSQTS